MPKSQDQQGHTQTGISAAAEMFNPTPERARLVRVDRQRNFSSSTVATETVAKIESAFRAVPWYRDRWRNKGFRSEIYRTLKHLARGGLVLIGPGIKFSDPPPFDELFEPIRLSGGFGADDAQLRVLSGNQPTRQERGKRIALLILSPLLFIGVAAILYGWLRGAGMRIAAVVGLVFGSVGFGLSIALLTEKLGAHWYLVPGGVAIARSRGKPANRLVLRTARDTPAFLRYVSSGKSVILMIELWTADGRRWQRGVSEREAISFLAAWQSAHPPPSIEQLREMVT